MGRRSGLPLRVVAFVALVSCTPERGPEPGPGPRPLEVTGTPLARGTYVTPDFSERLTFGVSGDTWLVRQEEPSIVTLTAPRTELAFATPSEVFVKLPDRFVPRARPLPRDLLRWLTSRPDLEASEPETVRIGGRDAVAVDVEVLELYEEAELLGCPLPCLPLAPSGGPEPLFLTHTHRVLVVEGGRPLLIVYSTGDASGERAARALLETVRFSPVSAPSA